MQVLPGEFGKLLPRHNAERRIDARPVFSVTRQHGIFWPRRAACGLGLAAIAVSQRLGNLEAKGPVAIELATDLLEKGIVSGPFDVDACLPVGIETALGKIGAADNRLGLSARLEDRKSTRLNSRH